MLMGLSEGNLNLFEIDCSNNETHNVKQLHAVLLNHVY